MLYSEGSMLTLNRLVHPTHGTERIGSRARALRLQIHGCAHTCAFQVWLAFGRPIWQMLSNVGLRTLLHSQCSNSSSLTFARMPKHRPFQRNSCLAALPDQSQ